MTAAYVCTGLPLIYNKLQLHCMEGRSVINVFIIHSGQDFEYVKETVEPYLLGIKTLDGEEGDHSGNANILTLESGNPSKWKKDARNKIKMAHAVIVVLGDDCMKESKKETMGWEVEQAVRFNKLIMILNRADHPSPDWIMTTDRFTKQKRPVAKQMTLEDIKKRIDDYSRGYYDIFSKSYEDLDPDKQTERKDELVKQYEMFQKTSEDLVTRRQDVNSFYITVNSAMTALLGIVLGIAKPPANLIVIGFMCIAGMILDMSWINILDAYGTLNSAKMKVINLLEEQLPVALYDVEWRIMSDKLNNRRYVSFTDSEKRIPKLFIIIYACILLALLIYVIWTYICH